MNTKILLGIIVIAALLRLWGISTNPPSLSWDEVSIGYNAYTILNYGMDEHGVRFPRRLPAPGQVLLRNRLRVLEGTVQ